MSYVNLDNAGRTDRTARGNAEAANLGGLKPLLQRVLGGIIAPQLARRTIAFCVAGLLAGLMACAPTPAKDAPTAAPRPAPTAPTSSGFGFTQSGQILPITANTVLGGKTIKLEVARTPEQQTMGLMFRPALPDDQGMLFPFRPARPVSFWMRNVPVALDMVFLYRGHIVSVSSQVPPCTTPICPTYGPGSTVDNVIELRAGRAVELGLKPKDAVTIVPVKTP
jgi:uncharacterized protein